jgi:hypothetical protein
VQQVLMTVNIGLRRQLWQLDYFTEGSIPDALIGVPQGWTPDQIKQFQDYPLPNPPPQVGEGRVREFSGDLAKRRRAKFVPGADQCTETTMKPSLPRTLSAVPHTLHVQLEIAKAIRALAAQDEDALLQRRTEIAAMRRECEALKRDMRIFEQECLVLLKAELRSELKKYSADQPRVPAGNSRGGQWTSEGGSGSPSSSSGAASDEPEHPTRYAARDTGTLTDETVGAPSNSHAHDDSAEPRTQVAANDSSQQKPIDLRDEEAPIGRGHAISEHVGKSDTELLVQMVKKTWRSPLISLHDRREGSFDSIDIANDLVSRALDAPENAAKVADIANGTVRIPRLITFDIGSVTGRELYLPDPDSQPYMRETDGVGVVIRYDPTRPRGYRIITAYPRTGPVEQEELP